ncbi:MAG: HEAT repeat domain-containing protein [Candidatus Zixiibacteriota bacterium]
MRNLEQARIVNVFIASPGEVEKERDSAERAINKQNDTIGRKLKVILAVDRYEKLAPGAGQPQELINRSLDRCDLFIGIVGERWGSPPDDAGKYTSGFESEFYRALQRRNETGRPEIWPFFKKVDSAREADAGPQLEKVIAFRKQVEEKRLALFRWYEDPSDLERQLLTLLPEYVVNRATESGRGETESTTTQRSELVTHNAVQSGSAGIQTERTFGSQLTDMVSRLGSDVADLISSGGEHDPEALTGFDIMRLSLLARSWYSRFHAYVLLSTHEINSLYKLRDVLITTEMERKLISRSTIGHSYKPNWYWSRQQSLDTCIRGAFYLASDDFNSEVQERALWFLTWARAHPKAFDVDIERFAYFTLGHESPDVSAAAQAFFEEVGEIDDIPILESGINASPEPTTEIVDKIRFAINAKNRPTDAFKYLLTRKADPEFGVIERLIDGSNLIENDQLEHALDHNSAAMRVFAARELSKRDTLTINKARSMLSDSSLAVRAVCCKYLIRSGAQIEPDHVSAWFAPQKSSFKFAVFNNNWQFKDDVLREVFGTWEAERLLDLVDWSAENVLAYEGLLLHHFELVSGSIRSDLSEITKRTAETFRMQLKHDLRHSHPSAEIMADAEKHLDMVMASAEVGPVLDAIAGKYIAAVLRALSSFGEASDIQIGRQYLIHTSYNVRQEAIRLVGQFGDESDAELLLAIVESDDFSLRLPAAAAALRLSPGIAGAAPRLLKLGDPAMTTMCLRSLWDCDVPDVMRLIGDNKLLHSSAPGTREAAIAYIAHNLDAKGLEKLLDEFLQNTTYFYDVVVWFDRILYSPPEVSDRYKMELKDKLFNPPSPLEFNQG